MGLFSINQKGKVGDSPANKEKISKQTFWALNDQFHFRQTKKAQKSSFKVEETKIHFVRLAGLLSKLYFFMHLNKTKTIKQSQKQKRQDQSTALDADCLSTSAQIRSEDHRSQLQQGIPTVNDFDRKASQ